MWESEQGGTPVRAPWVAGEPLMEMEAQELSSWEAGQGHGGGNLALNEEEKFVSLYKMASYNNYKNSADRVWQVGSVSEAIKENYKVVDLTKEN